MRKLYSIFLTIIMLSLVVCGGNSKTSTNTLEYSQEQSNEKIVELEVVEAEKKLDSEDKVSETNESILISKESEIIVEAQEITPDAFCEA